MVLGVTASLKLFTPHKFPLRNNKLQSGKTLIFAKIAHSKTRIFFKNCENAEPKKRSRRVPTWYIGWNDDHVILRATRRGMEGIL